MLTSNGSKQKSVRSVILTELLHVHEDFLKEQENTFNKPLISKKVKSKRLMQLFQKDLLPGVTGLILENKRNRDNAKVRQVSKSAKTIGWILLGCLNLSMFIYVFLFVLAESASRQSAWIESFILWIVFEILLMSTTTVLVMNIMIPAMIMSEVMQIKEKLMDSVKQYHHSLHSTEVTEESDQLVLESSQLQEIEHLSNPKRFNAASFLFLSYRLASQFCHRSRGVKTQTTETKESLKVAQIIRQFSTPWPRQSYQRSFDVAQKYSKKTSAISRSASLVLVFLLTNMLNMPLTIQVIIKSIAVYSLTMCILTC